MKRGAKDDPVYYDVAKQKAFKQLVRTVTDGEKVQKELMSMMEKIGYEDAKLVLELERAREKVLRTVHQAEAALYKFAQNTQRFTKYGSKRLIKFYFSSQQM